LNQEETSEIQATIPLIQQALGYKAFESETERRLTEFIKENWK
jgi:hypothetical protein